MANWYIDRSRNSKKKVMIVGVCQKGGQDPNAIYCSTC